MKILFIFFRSFWFCFPPLGQDRVFLELIFIYAMKNSPVPFSAHVDTPLSQHILLQRLSFPRCPIVAVHKSRDCVCVELFLNSSSPLTFVSIQHQYHTILITVALE